MNCPQLSINGYWIDCHKKDQNIISYKLSGLPLAMRSDVVSQYSTLYRDTQKNFIAAAYETGSQDNNPVLTKLATEEAQKRANAYLTNVMKMIKGHTGKDTYLDSKDRFRLEFLMLWETESPDSILLDKEQNGSLDTDSASELKRQRRARWKAVRAFCTKENISCPSSGTQDSADGNGTKFKRLIGREWLQKQLNKRSKTGEQHRARCAGRIGKHGDRAVTEEAFKEWQQAQKDGYQYMKDTVFISHEDDEVDMLTVYNSSTANPKNRKIKVITLLSGLVKYAEKYGWKFIMITPTAASEHHPAPRKSSDGQWVLNPKYNTKWTVKKTHNHLNDIFKRCASALDRENIEFFALKGVEAHKDGTPHHHCGFFYKGGSLKKVKDVFNWYFRETDKIVAEFKNGDYKHRNKITFEQGLLIRKHLKETQVGALTRRVNYKEFDPKGDATLATYIIKDVLGYVIKDIREDDESGEPETLKQAEKRTNQERGAAWASLHGINQFSMIRVQASMGIWDELRRIHETVEGSTQLEAERRACCGTFGTEAHTDPETRQRPDFCKFMELRRSPVGDCKPVELITEGEYESDGTTSKLGGFGDELERISGVRSKSEGLKIITRPVRWRAVNVPTLLDEVVKRETPSTGVGDFNPDTENELREVWGDLLETARKQKTLHQFGRAVYNWPVSDHAAVDFDKRAQPIVTWEIINNRTFPDSNDWKEDIPINPENTSHGAADNDFKQVQPHIAGQDLPVENIEVAA